MQKSFNLCKLFIISLCISLLFFFIGQNMNLKALARDSVDNSENSQTYEFYTYHVHYGSPGSGCYTRLVESESRDLHGDSYCGAGPCGPDSSGQVYYVGTCYRCGATISRYGSPGLSGCDNYDIIYSHSYELGCNQSTDTITGTVKVNISPKEWSKSKDITVTYNNEAVNAFINQSETNKNPFTITENGTYTIELSQTNGSSGIKQNIQIDTIDNQAPVIHSTNYDKTPNLPQTRLSVDASDDGCGLATEAYSFDNGQTWQSEPNITVTQNQTVKIVVRDMLGNQAYANVNITNLDNCSPKLSCTYTPVTDTYDSVTITFSATDLNEDGSEGIGFNDECFSYDNMKTFTSDNSIIVHENGEYTAYVKDKNGNTASLTCIISNIVPKPVPETPSFDLDNPSDITPSDSLQEEESQTDVTPIPSAVQDTPELQHTFETNPNNSYISVKYDTNTTLSTTKQDIKKEVKDVIIPTKEASKEVITYNVTNEDPVPSNDTDNRLLITIGTILLLPALFLLFMFLTCFASIFCLSSDNRYGFKGITRIKHHNDCYEVNISKKMASDFDTNEIKVQFPYFFRLFHKNTDVVIYIADFDTTVCKPEKAVLIKFRE